MRLNRMGVLLLASLAVAALATCSAAAGAGTEPAYALVTKEVKTIKGVLTFVIHSPESTAKAWVLMAPQAPELPRQKETSTRLVPDGQGCADLSPRSRSLLRAVIPVNEPSLEHSLSGQVEIQATLYSRSLVRRRAGQAYPPAEKLAARERKLTLAETPTLNFSAGEFQRWLRDKQLRKKPSESDLDFGRRAFLAIRKAYRYEITPNVDHHASFLCQQDKAECGGFSVLFTATLRANKVPARVLFGLWAKSSTPGETIAGSSVVNWRQHVKAEFYANGVGWIPVDVSRAVTADKSPGGLEYFGDDRGDFVVEHVDPDFRFDSGLFGPKSPENMVPFKYYATGEGDFSHLKIDRDWQVETLSAVTDQFSPGSIWVNDVVTFTVLERTERSFRARFEAPGCEREVTGSIDGYKVSWLSKDVRAVKGSRGGDLTGEISGQTIGFQWHDDSGKSGAFSLHLKGETL